MLQEKAMSFSALGFTRHLSGDLDGAIESYHQALSRKPDDPFAGEMLNRAMRETLELGTLFCDFNRELSSSISKFKVCEKKGGASFWMEWNCSQASNLRRNQQGSKRLVQ